MSRLPLLLLALAGCNVLGNNPPRLISFNGQPFDNN